MANISRTCCCTHAPVFCIQLVTAFKPESPSIAIYFFKACFLSPYGGGAIHIPHTAADWIL